MEYYMEIKTNSHVIIDEKLGESHKQDQALKTSPKEPTLYDLISIKF